MFDNPREEQDLVYNVGKILLLVLVMRCSLKPGSNLYMIFFYFTLNL